MSSVVLVTGGSSGIGEASAMRFAQEGYRVAIAARKLGNLTQVEQKLKQSGVQVLAIQADVSVAAQVEQMVETVVNAWGQIDVLIHSAGVLCQGTIIDSDEATWDRVIDINLKGTYLTNRCVIQQMIQQRSGSIVNVASDAGLMGAPDLAVYCASKGGVVLLTRALAVDHIRQGIRVNSLCPGPVDTPMTADIPSEVFEKFQQTIPAQRYATTEEIAEAAYFLAHAKYMVGSCLTIDGGNTAAMAA